MKISISQVFSQENSLVFQRFFTGSHPIVFSLNMTLVSLNIFLFELNMILDSLNMTLYLD